ncbi:ATP-binding protein, partial [Pseudomonas sp. LF135]
AETGGYGLGLSIAHTIARAHEGRLSLSNREGGGLEVVLLLWRAGLPRAGVRSSPKT